MKPRLLLLALLAAAATLAVGGGIVLAQSKVLPDEDGYIPYIAKDNPMGWNIPYTFYTGDDYPAYVIALKAMNPTYKGKLEYNPYPLIGIAEIDLNKDKLSEIISFPTEEEEEEGRFCNLNGLCPHYVIQVQDKKAKVLGVLYGYKVNRGDRIANGYWTLNAYTLPIKNPKFFEEYAYNPSTKEYELVR